MAQERPIARVLIVDDDEGLNILMADALREEGYEVSTERSGGAALQAMARRRPDLMLLDLKMQDMDGTVLLRQMRERAIVVPFVVVTGRGDEKVAVETMKEGALDYVMKDTGLLDLLPSVVRRAVDGIAKDRALERARADGRRLEQEIVAISEMERQSIGADLHDGLGQQLTAIELICTGIKKDIEVVDQGLGRRVDQMTRMLREAVAQTRVLSRELVPVREGTDALQTALAELSQRIDSSGAIKCRFECTDTVEVANPEMAKHLYRIAQEAVNNALRHGKPREIHIRLRNAPGGPWMQIADDGVGIPKEDTRRAGVGLRMMRHRAGVIGAQLSVKGGKGSGTSVTCWFEA